MTNNTRKSARIGAVQAKTKEFYLDFNQEDDAYWANVFFEPVDYPTTHVIDYKEYEATQKMLVEIAENCQNVELENEKLRARIKELENE